MNIAITQHLKRSSQLWLRQFTMLFTPSNRLALLLASSLLLLQACSGGSGSAPTINPANNNSSGGSNYTGPEPQTADVQAFRVNLWENLRSEQRCGACHTANNQSPAFVRFDDINLAYGDANDIVDLDIPANSRMVIKVAEGHNCWQGNDQTAVNACATIIEGYISAWANDSQGGSSTQVQLIAPPVIDAGASKNYPALADDTNFASTVHPLLTAHCSSCHTPDALVPQAPYFGVSNVQDAYIAAQSKMDLNTPENSRFVTRLADEFHNCWTNQCEDDANSMLSAIASLAGTLSVTAPAPSLLLSKALSLPQGILANSGGRHEENVIAQYEFRSGTGNIAYDTSGVSPELNLSLTGNVEWVGGWGIRLIDGKAQGSTTDSSKLHELITATGEYSIEAWVAPANVSQGDAQDPARIVSYSGGTDTRNFTLGQNLYNYEFMARSSNSDANGTPVLATDDESEVLQATLQHVVITYDPVTGRRIYVNGLLTDNSDPVDGGTLGEWNDTFAFVLGNEVSSDRQWQGVIRMVAVHNRVLSDVQIRTNYDVGVGEKFFLLFGINDYVSTPQSYIVFEVSQYDSYSYLFDKPFYTSLDKSAPSINFSLAGMRLGINGRETDVGQSYISVDTTINSNNQSLSSLGTIIALEQGAEADQFFLTFEKIASESNTATTTVPTTLSVALDGASSSDIGLRTFDEVSASMGAITGINIASHPALLNTFNTIRKALPMVADIETFLSSHQMSITQLGIAYCDVLIETRPEFFPGVDFNASLPLVARPSVTTPIVNAVLGSNISTQPDSNDTEAELDGLFDVLCGAGQGCSAAQTAPAGKAVCAAILSSAALSIK